MISIIISLYKTDRYLNSFSGHLKKFADALMRANLAFEIIAIANDPSEREKQFAKEFSGQNWFLSISVERESVFASFNRGMNLAKGDILGFWNTDDIRYPLALVEARDLFDKGAELVYFPFLIRRYFNIGFWHLPLFRQKIDSQIPEFNQKTLPEFKKSMFCGPFFMFTKSLYEKVGPFDEQFKIAGDFDWCARAAQKTNRIKKAKSLGGEFRIDGGGLSAGGSLRQRVENNVVYMRNHIQDKIVAINDPLINEYRSQFLKIGGKYIDLKKYS